MCDNFSILWDDYFQYLIYNYNLQQYKKMKKIFERLHNMDFIYVLERDANRWDDGINLRVNYRIPEMFSKKDCDAFYDHPCSVFEMMLALAIRIDNEYIGDPNEEHPETFFMEMIYNLGLYSRRGEQFNDSVIDRWLMRKFSQNGVGSPFPIRRPTKNQQVLEIWDQAICYINENY